MRNFKVNYGNMIARPDAINQIKNTLGLHPVAALLGPRQCGITTLAGEFSKGRSEAYFDLENQVDPRRLSSPLRALKGLSGLVVIDEVQRRPRTKRGRPR
jgi:uncharacterized protein